YVNKIFVTYEGHELTETKASTIRTIHSVPSIVEMESLDTELSGIQKEHKAKQLKPLLWMNDTIEKR
ncbi:ammonium transporter Amt1, partial [Biomphalaria glabrata]